MTSYEFIERLKDLEQSKCRIAHKMSNTFQRILYFFRGKGSLVSL